MTEEIPQVEILFSDDFKSRLRALAKRYRSIRSDLQPLLDEIQSGDLPGDRIIVIYSKSDQDDFPSDQISDIIATFNQ